MQFDLLIQGGELIDPGAGLTTALDIAIQGETIAAVDRGIPAQAAGKVIDAAGMVVTPGLVDLHTHVYWGASWWGIHPDAVASQTGVTTWVDAGSAGAYTFPGFRRYIVEACQSRVLALLNISAIGLPGMTGELASLDYCDLPMAVRTVETNRDVIVGIKARIDPETTQGTGIEPLRLARRLADEVDLPLMVHIWYGPPSLPEIIELLRPGDVLTHCFTGHEHRILGPDGRLLEFVRRAWDRGLVLDIGHGTGSFSYEVAEALIAQGLLPDVISSDAHQLSVQGPMYDLPTTLSKFLNLGLTLPEVVSRATSRPAQVVRRPHLGTLRPGAPADAALFRLEEGDFAFYDVSMASRRGTVRLVPVLTIRAGQPIEPLPLEEPAPWAVLPEEQQSLLGQRPPACD